MKDWKVLLQQAEAKATAALEVDSVEEREKLNADAEALITEAQSIKASLDIQERLKKAVLPADLPTGDETGEAEPEPTKAFEPFYQLRYGTESEEIKAVLADVHGPDYRQQRYEKQLDFVKYLRTPNDPRIGKWGRTFLWTPETVKMALEEGQDVRGMKTVMVSAVDELGGYLVPEDFRNEIIQRLPALSVMRPLCRVVSTSRDKVSFPKITGGDGQYRSAVRVTWVDETPTAGTAATSYTVGMESISVHTGMAETYISRNHVEDAAFNIVAWLAEEFAMAKAGDENYQLIRGDGNGKPQGILAGAQTLSSTDISSTNSGSNSGLNTGDEIITMEFALDAQYRQNARWLAAKAFYRDARKLKTGDGEYIWERDYQAGTPAKLLGYPVLESENVPAHTTQNNYSALFGDFYRAYWIVDRVGMSVERYLTGSEARVNQVMYIARFRTGGQCVAGWAIAALKTSA